MGSSPKWIGRSTIVSIVFYFDFFYRIPLHKNPGNKLNFFSASVKKTFQIWALYLEAAPLAEFHFKFEKGKGLEGPYKRSLHFCKVSLQKW
jgi:hypothetical protein